MIPMKNFKCIVCAERHPEKRTGSLLCLVKKNFIKCGPLVSVAGDCSSFGVKEVFNSPLVHIKYFLR